MLRVCPRCAYVAGGLPDVEAHAEKRGLDHASGPWLAVPGQERLAVEGWAR